jgi:PAS domain S-box-containing protein
MSLLGWESWAIGIDVTERQAYERALRNVERRYSALVNQAHNAVFFGRLDNPEYIVELNETAARMLGYDPSQTTRLHISQVVPPDQDEAREAMLDRLLNGEDLPVYERIVQRRDGSRFPIEINAIVIRDETGKPWQVMSICRDISERKAMEARLRISESWFRAVFNSRVLMVIVLDAFGSMVKVNPALAESLGYTREAMQHTPFERYVHPDDLAEAMETFAAIRQGERDSGQATIRTLHSNGQIVWLDLVGVVQRDEDGQFQSIVIVGKDITLERDTEQIVFHLAVERERLRVIAEFIEAASHEFRTPLSRINTNLYLLRKQLGEESVAPYVDRIEDESNNLVQLIEGLFKMVHLSSDHRYTFEHVDVNQLVAIAVGRVNARVEATGQKLTQDLDETLPLIFLEPDLIAETLVQVLDNAIRYTPNDGTIRIMTRQGEDSVVITVTDSGIGMEPQVLPHVFNQFYREDTARSTPGLGLGLSIAKKIVEHHRGQINITSEQGQGTTVTIQLPLPESPTV